MTNPNYTHISFVLDRSGSMQLLRGDTIGGFNSFLSDQQKVSGKATLTLAQFDHEYRLDYSMVPIAEALPLNDLTYIPRGMTALYDAIGRTIAATGEKLAAMSENDRPSKVLFVILTDGFENCSREYNAVQVKQIIEEQRSIYSWEFVFLGASEASLTDASRIGGSNIQKFEPTKEGVKLAYSTLSEATRSFRVAADYKSDSFWGK